jgi:dTDP-4-dehydrorhamnose reductase
MTTLVTGACGQLGRQLRRDRPADIEALFLTRADLDITQRDAVEERLRAERPEVVINAAAIRVDQTEKEPERGETVNAEGPAILARAAGEIGARLIHVSTDYVFDGTKSSPYLPADEPRPIQPYGRTKLAGEQAVLRILGPAALVLRTGWLYSAYRRNFVKTMLRLMRERDELTVVCDKVGTPTWTGTLAPALWTAAGKPEVSGLHQWTDAGAASWYDFAVMIQDEALRLDLLERRIPVRPIDSAHYPGSESRPAYTLMDKSATWEALGLEPVHWTVALRRMLRELKEIESRD